MRERYATPSAGRFPQARIVTLVVCGTRRLLGAVVGSCALSEQALWDQLVAQLAPGTLNVADRNFFSMNRWRTAAGTGAHLIWRVKNGAKSLPAKVISTLPDGSHLVALHESDSMLTTRRKASGDKLASRLQDITARLVEFTVTATDEAGAVPDEPVPGPDDPPGPRRAPCQGRRGVLRAALAGRAGLQDDQVHPARAGPPPARAGPRPGRTGDLGPTHRRQRPRRPSHHRSRRPRRDLLHRRLARHPRPRCQALRSVRSPCDQPGPHRRDHHRATEPHRPRPHQPPQPSGSTDPTHAKRVLHHRDHVNESTQNGMKRLNFRAVGLHLEGYSQ